MKTALTQELQKSVDLFKTLLNDNRTDEQVTVIVEVIIDALQKGKKILFCGNGGSAADAQHLAAEFVSRFSFDRPALKAIALTVDTSALTAIANDYSYDYVFARQVEALANPGDVVVGISTSGKSKNVLAALKTAKEKQAITIGFLGQDGCDIGQMVDHQLNIPSKETPKIQEGHITIGHIVCAIVERQLFSLLHAEHHMHVA
ncbi:D-sedoheptulose 7-phosphate isomerase [Candidatus Paracaedibacter acanthamoebae]|uniref:D-sedoheptulose 7-phosphate isomerase n=1 Tax=Candidatus Odyssella acanthamoebae TaxID=91604 RepID=UPI00068A0816